MTRDGEATPEPEPDPAIVAAGLAMLRRGGMTPWQIRDALARQFRISRPAAERALTRIAVASMDAMIVRYGGDAEVAAKKRLEELRGGRQE